LEALLSPPSERIGSRIIAAIFLSFLNKFFASSRDFSSSLLFSFSYFANGYLIVGNVNLGHLKAGSPTLCSLLVFVKESEPKPLPWNALFIATTD